MDKTAIRHSGTIVPVVFKNILHGLFQPMKNIVQRRSILLLSRGRPVMRNRKTIAVVVFISMLSFFAIRAVAAPGQSPTGVEKQKSVSTKSSSSAPDSVKTATDSLPAQVASAPQCTLSIKTDPAGAAVYIDDSLKGETPLTIPGVAPGNYTLILKKKGCFLKKAEIAVDSSTRQKDLAFVLLQPGFLKVESTPSGAELWIDDKKEGTTPYQTDRIKPGDHSIKLTLKKYTPMERTITISNGGRDSLNMTLEYTREYKDEMAAEEAARSREKKERMYLGIVSGVFALGAIVFVFIEAIGQ